MEVKKFELVEYEAGTFHISLPDIWDTQVDVKLDTVSSSQTVLDGHFATNVTVSTEQLSKEMTYEQYFNDHLIRTPNVRYFKQVSPTSVVIVNGVEALEYVYINVLNKEYPLLTKKVFYVEDNIGYIIKCETTAEDYDSYQNVFNHIVKFNPIVDSFRVNSTVHDEGQEIAMYINKLINIETNGALNLPASSFKLISEHHQLFPAKTEQDIQAVKDATSDPVDIELLGKDITPYSGKILSYTGFIVTDSDELQMKDEDGIFSDVYMILDEKEAEAEDEEEKTFYKVIIPKTTKGLTYMAHGRFWAIPIGWARFKNEMGGYTNQLLCIGLHLDMR
ncbi:hypothetical protein [Longirhabdus pacifica]|uniref:hypothetical protein n=1 Tax=Longirhabdus pacifica TaxID=2305227 RepID=UPI001008EDE1|nr:hypothetical protein [Longirhabdus pacifica]